MILLLIEFKCSKSNTHCFSSNALISPLFSSNHCKSSGTSVGFLCHQSIFVFSIAGSVFTSVLTGSVFTSVLTGSVFTSVLTGSVFTSVFHSNAFFNNFNLFIILSHCFSVLLYSLFSAFVFLELYIFSASPSKSDLFILLSGSEKNQCSNLKKDATLSLRVNHDSRYQWLPVASTNIFFPSSGNSVNKRLTMLFKLYLHTVDGLCIVSVNALIAKSNTALHASLSLIRASN
jgi:hypothetical protein